MAETLMHIASISNQTGEDDLLATIDLYKDQNDPDSRKQVNIALTELLQRHQEYLIGVAKHVAKNFPLLDYEVVYSEFAKRLITCSNKYNFKTSSTRTIEKQFRSQAGKFIEHIVKEEIRNSSSERLDDSLALKATPSHKETISPEAEELRTIMNDILSEKEKNVLWAWNLFVPLDGGQGRMSSEDVTNLAKNLQTTPVNIRQIRRRAMAKIRKAAPHLYPSA